MSTNNSTTRRSRTLLPGTPDSTYQNRDRAYSGLEPNPVVVGADHNWMYLAGTVIDRHVASRLNPEGFDSNGDDLSDVGFVDRAVTNDPTDAIIEALDSGMPFEVYLALATADDEDLEALGLGDDDDNEDPDDLDQPFPGEDKVIEFLYR